MASRMSADRRRLLGMRVRAQLLDSPAASPHEAVRHMLALQAQDWFASLWAVGSRSGASADAVAQAQRDRQIVRSWPMRGTLHWTLAEDIGWLTALSRDRIHRAAASRHRRLELDDRAFETAELVARSVLHGGCEADRSVLLAAFAEAGLPVDAQRGPHLLGYLAQQAIVVMTSRSTYALHDDWVVAPRSLSRSESLAELVFRYVHSHGPVTDHDLAWWAGLTLADARAGLDANRASLDTITLEGTKYWVAPGAGEAASGVHLLAAFDEAVIGYTGRDAVLGDEPLARIVPGNNGMFLASLLIDGQVAATWKRTLRPAAVGITFDTWQSIPTKRLPAIRRELAAYADHLGLGIGDVTGLTQRAASTHIQTTPNLAG